MRPRVSDGDEVRVEVYCRPSTDAVVPLDCHHGRLTRLSRAGVVDELAVDSWPGRVSLPPADAPADLSRERREAVRTRATFGEWADEAGVALGPAFGRRSYESAITGESGELFRFPVVGLAVRVDGDLAAVYPHEDDGAVTVEEGIDRLAVGEPAANATGARPGYVGD